MPVEVEARRKRLPVVAVLLLLLLLLATCVDAQKAKYSLALTGIDSGTAYTLSVKVGTATGGAINTFRLIADTGSSNDAVLGANCCGDGAEVTFSCSASPSCSASTSEVAIAFAGASISGHYVSDQWSSKEVGTVAKKFLVIERQESFYRAEYDGITGLAYTALAQPRASPQPAFYQDLVAAGATRDVFGMQLCGIMQPLLTAAKANFSLHAGQLLVGGLEGPGGESYYAGPMLFTPIAREAWYVVIVSDIGFNGKSLGIACNKYNDPQAIIDSGTSNMAFPSEVYNALMAQIKAATLAVLPDFDPNYFDARKSCCGVDYCDPRIPAAALLRMPSISITLALQSGDDSAAATSQHFTVEIPPEHYWRPEMNGADNDIPCRAIGISEGSGIMLGDVFMDGLYTYHDRTAQKIGLAVTTNCPNGVKSTKKVYAAPAKTDDWCACFSSSLQTKSLLARHVPWGSGCFFWVWWMYVVLASVVVLLLAVGVGVYWFLTDKKMKKMKADARLHRGSDAHTRRGSGSSTLALVPPHAPPSRGAGTSGKAPPPPTPRLEQPPPPTPLPPLAAETSTHYVQMSSPQSALSDASSIALLSSPSASQRLSASASTTKYRRRGSSRDSYSGESAV
ncbi:hypothetical protein PybrP1_002561 [[Pythium] brassicae (nom. inval.)]|nr:hypothetical protein PybrP1_002561 [[Pythium] brassicae (nom. inval.)]